jgi:hypothetical protein
MALRVRALLVLSVLAGALAAGCGGGGGLFGRQYEYEEDLYLNLDGSGTLIVNTSIPALVALRGVDLNPDPARRVDRNRVRAWFTSPAAEVTRVSREWRRAGRRFVQVRLDVPDVRRLSEAAPFSWSTYQLSQQDGLHVYKQHVGPSAFRPGTLQNVGWSGKELVAFRLHLPSRIEWHNARDIETNEPREHERGNILRWEQALADRLDGVPIDVEVRMQSQSILYRTLWLFAGAFLAAVALLALLVWLMIRKGAKQEASTSP